MKTEAICENGVLKLLEKLDLPEQKNVSVTVKGCFSTVIEEVDEIETEDGGDYYG